MKNKIIAIFSIFIYVFAFCSSVFCTSLILQKVTNTNNNYITLAFFICIFLVGFLINTNQKVGDEK